MGNNIKIQEPPNKMRFVVDEVMIGSDRLCIKFFDMVLDLENIKVLEFNIAGKKYIYKRK